MTNSPDNGVVASPPVSYLKRAIYTIPFVTVLWEVFVYAGIAGAYGFGMASAIWGGVAVDRYNKGVASNDSVAASRNQLSYRSVS